MHSVFATRNTYVVCRRDATLLRRDIISRCKFTIDRLFHPRAIVSQRTTHTPHHLFVANANTFLCKKNKKVCKKNQEEM